MTGFCLCGTELPAVNHPVFTVSGFTMIECPNAPPGELWMFNPEHVHIAPRIPRPEQVW